MRWQLLIPSMAILNPNIRGATRGRLAAAILLSAAVGMVFADESRNPVFAGRAGAEFHRAQTQFQSHTNDSAAAWQFARACYDFADFATNSSDRAALAELGVAACRQLLVREPKSVPGHYYLGMNFGQLADAEAPSMAAYKLVHEVEREFKSAAELDEHFDFAGPARNLGETLFSGPWLAFERRRQNTRRANGWNAPSNWRPITRKTI